MKKYFITANHTGAGKTLIAAILTQKWGAAYWKPVQTGAAEDSDTKTVKRLVSHPHAVFLPEAIVLNAALSPHIAAKMEDREVLPADIVIPECSKEYLIIEGAGGLLVPLNEHGDTMADIIMQLQAEVIFVSHYYMGSINHTLLSLAYMRSRNIKVKGIIMNGEPMQGSRECIVKMQPVPIIGDIPYHSLWDARAVSEAVKLINLL